MLREYSCAILIAAASLGAASHAVRADEASKNWTGAYVGVVGAITDVGGNLTTTIGEPFVSSSAQSLGGADRDVAGSLVGGVNLQLRNFVVGLQLEVDPFGTTHARDCQYYWADGFESNVFISDTKVAGCARSISWSGSALVRAGALLTDDMLLYGVVGWTTATVREKLRDMDDIRERLDGIAIGVGIEQRLLDQWHLSIEARATYFETKSLSQPVVNPNLSFAQQQNTNIELDARSLRLGLTYQFPRSW